MPLTYAGRVDVEEPATDLQQQARKIKPQYAQGDLRRVAVARHQAEGEFIQNLLLEEGVPSVLRRATWDVPEMLASGPRAVMVAESGLEVALQVLGKTELEVMVEEQQARAAKPSPAILLAGVIGSAGVVALLVLLAKATG